MKMIRIAAAAVLALVSMTAIAAQGLGGGLALYSSYVLGVGNRVDDGPVAQGWLRYTRHCFYGELWGSVSANAPLGKNQFGNEVDKTLGADCKLSDQWSFDVHLSHFDIANPRLFDFDGDLLAVSGTLRFHATPATTVHANVEDYEGYGRNRFLGGQRLSLGVSSSIGPIAFDALVRRNNHIGSPVSGQLGRLLLSSKKPVMETGGIAWRPELIWYQPFGSYRDTHRTEVVVGVVGTW